MSGPWRGSALDVGIDYLDRRAPAPSEPFVAADIGGTHARVALLRASPDAASGVQTLAYRVFACAQFATLVALLREFLATDARMPVKHCVLACAGQLMGNDVVNDNLAWPIHLGDVQGALGFDHVGILNDFEALAYALDGSLTDTVQHLCGPVAPARGPTLVIGPGTGLGAAVHLPGTDGGFVLPTEAGQMDFAPTSLREREILAHIAPDGGYVPYEHLVSGPGLLTIYTALCALDRVEPLQASPEAVSRAAVAMDELQAVEALNIFCACLGSLAGNLAIAFMPTGGVYLAGGFLSSIVGWLKRSEFTERFLHGRSARAFLQEVPVWVTEHGRHGVHGAARWYLQHGAARAGTLVGDAR
jgi:glucokinase